MNKYLIHINAKNRILEYVLPGEDNRQGTLDLSEQMGIPELIFSYEVWDGVWYFQSNKYVRISLEHRVQENLELSDGLMFNIKIRSSGVRLTGAVYVINSSMTNYSKYDISSLDVITIGKGGAMNIRIRKDYISKEQATFFRSGNDWYVQDDQSTNGTFLNTVRISQPTKLNIGDSIYMVGFKVIFLGSFIAVNRTADIDISIPTLDPNRISSRQKYLDGSAFSRAPRFIEPLDEELVDIEAPPQKDKARKTPLLFILGPSVTMPIPILMTVLFNAMVNKNGGGASSYIGMLISVVMFALIGVMWAVLRNRYDERTRKEVEQERVQAYNTYIRQNDQLLGEKMVHNKTVLETTYPSSQELARSIPSNNIILWNRNVNHSDFLTIRLGIGYVKSPVPVKVPQERFSVYQDQLVQLPRQVYQKYEFIPETVKTFSLRDTRIVGVIGETSGIEALAVNMMIQIAALHSYTDVKIAMLYDSKYSFEWMKWLPHTFSHDKKNRFIGNDESSIQNTIYSLTNELRLRSERMEEENGKYQFKDRYVVFCTAKSFLENETLYQYMVSGEDYGFTFVLLYGTVNDLPNECNLILETSSNYRGMYILDQAYDQTRDITFDTISREAAEKFARYMCQYTVSELSEGQIPDSIDYFSMIGIHRLEEWDLIKNYKRNRSYEGLPSFVGLSAGNKPVFLDIHEKKYGPHGLVAGTTGSGKSETIQTFILSLAMNFSPNEVAFILIDYKGGGMANAFLDLPHTAGTITNLGTGEDAAASDTVDPNQMRRALISIRSEIKRRQSIFNQYKVNQIDLYMRLYREHKAEEPLPHLIIISDEFAELKKEQPEFIKELVSTARVGRSLGIHLILATQKPAGVVDDEIWSNSRFKLCLRVQDKQDSMGMLKRPEAAYLTQTGRAYLQIGNDEIFEMFQSGYSGADYDPKDAEQGTADSMSMIGIDGHALNVKHSKNTSKENKISQLEASVEYISRVSEENGIKKTRPLWLPALSDKVFLGDILQDYSIDFTRGLITVLGLIDIPERQLIEPFTVNLNTISNMMIAGINSSGKTNMIKTMVTSLSMKYTADYVQFYIMDFSSRTLKLFNDLPQVGDVFYPEESEGILRTIQFAQESIADRTAMFQRAGIGSFNEYNESLRDSVLPALVFIIDNYFEFVNEYPNEEDNLLKLTRDGSRYGIQFITTVNRASDMRYKLRQNFTCLIPLRLVEKSDYLDMLGKSPEFIPSVIAGRGLIYKESVFEFQTALPVYGNNESERNNLLRESIAQHKAQYVGTVAKRIPILPKDKSYEEILQDDGSALMKRNILPVGYDIDKIELLGIDAQRTYCYTVWGTSRSSVQQVLRNTMIAATQLGSEVHLVSNDTAMEGLQKYTEISAHKGYEGLFDLLILLKNAFKDRSNRRKELTEAGETDLTQKLTEEFGRIVVAVDSLQEFLSIVYDEDNPDKMFPLVELFMKQGANLGILFVFGQIGELPVRNLASKTAKTIFEYQAGICLGGLLNAQNLFSFDMSLNLLTKKQPDNIGYTILDGKTVKIYVPEN